MAPVGDNISLLLLVTTGTTNNITAMKDPPNPPELKEVGLAAMSAGEGRSNCNCLPSFWVLQWVVHVALGLGR